MKEKNKDDQFEDADIFNLSPDGYESEMRALISVYPIESQQRLEGLANIEKYRDRRRYLIEINDL